MSSLADPGIAGRAGPDRQPAPLGALRADIRRTYDYLEGNRAMKVIHCARSPGVQTVAVYRLGQWLGGQPVLVRLFLEPVFLLLQLSVHVCWGIELPRAARIGPGLYIGHFGGITVSRDARIGSNCNLSQNVTIGVAGTGAKRGAPTIGDNVYIAPGARIFGRIRVGNNVQVGANAVVHADIPDDADVVLDPGFHIHSFSGKGAGCPVG
ncbi:MAG TPA: serine acetyltransferase [Steroidobacteraceae bacterium]|nr:serine acetyltransferase [Steroidobacteraceae bacterium]